MLVPVVLLLVIGLAAANGANDVAKGVATLAGSGATSYRTAILWGAFTTLAGAALSGLFAERMFRLFSSGIVTAPPTPVFTVAVAIAAAAWVALATRFRLPVSTTHALIGALVGAGVAMAPASVAWAALLPKLAAPLLLSIGAAYGLSALLGALRPAPAAECICVGVEALDTGTGHRLPQLAVRTGTQAECRVHAGSAAKLTADGLHWLSSGLVGFARGLNDAPKLVALGGVLLGSAVEPQVMLAAVAIAMLIGSVMAGHRIARVLAEDIVTMSPREGLHANLAAAVLVGFGAHAGLPMSTTHVTTAAIAGIAGRHHARLSGSTLKGIVLAWTVTPGVTGILAFVAYHAAQRLT